MGFDREMDKTSADMNSKVYGMDNLFLGGCGNIGTAFPSNSTLAAMELAIKSWEYIKATLKPSVVAASEERGESADRPTIACSQGECKKKVLNEYKPGL